MGIHPVWFLFKIEDKDMLQVKLAFDRAVKKSAISDNLRQFLQERTTEGIIFAGEDYIFNSFCSETSIDKRFDNGEFNWIDLHKTYYLFFPEPFMELLTELFVRNPPILSKSIQESIVEMIITNRVGATEMLWGGLGWKKANILPGYLGNMLVKTEEVESVLTTIEKIFEEVNYDEFIERAKCIGIRGNCNESIAEILPFLILSALRKISEENKGFLALSHPHIGSIKPEIFIE